MQIGEGARGRIRGRGRHARLGHANQAQEGTRHKWDFGQLGSTKPIARARHGYTVPADAASRPRPGGISTPYPGHAPHPAEMMSWDLVALGWPGLGKASSVGICSVVQG